MDKIILRGKITEDGKVELLDPIPDDFDQNQTVEVKLIMKLSTNTAIG